MITKQQGVELYAKKQMVQYNLFLADGYSVSEYRCSCYGAGNQPYRYRGRSRKSINAHIESADTADTGNISLLGGLIQADNLLSALSAVYPTEKHTAIYGPMRNLDMNTWNTWVTYIGQYGAYGSHRRRPDGYSHYYIGRFFGKLAVYGSGH